MDLLVPFINFQCHLLQYMVGKNREWESTTEDGTFQKSYIPCLTGSFIIGIEFESPGDVVVNNWAKAVALYCLFSVHPECTYSWKMIEKPLTFPSTPIIYVNKAGMYQCEVKYGSRKIQGKVIHVHVEVGMFFSFLICSGGKDSLFFRFGV